MPDDDLTSFVEACRESDLRISIRGSTAYTLSRKADADSGLIAKGSIIGSVPPLADLDLVVRDERPRSAIRKVGEVLERFRAFVPAARFIHVDVFYEHLPVRKDSPLGNVVLRNLPEVSIGIHEGYGEKWKAVVSPRDRLVEADVNPRIRVTLFRDFLFLLRLSQRHPELGPATREVAGLLLREDPYEVGLAVRRYGGARELARIDKALAKHAMLQAADIEPTPMAEHLSRPWLTKISTLLNGISWRIVRDESPESPWRQRRTTAYAANGRIMRFAEVADLDAEEQRMFEEKLAPETEQLKQRLTPSLKVALPDADDPEGRGYTDFSKGVSELVFRDPAIGPLMDVALMEGREKYYAVVAQASEGLGVRSLRTDPGFMGMLNHRSLRTVRLAGVQRQ